MSRTRQRVAKYALRLSTAPWEPGPAPIIEKALLAALAAEGVAVVADRDARDLRLIADAQLRLAKNLAQLAVRAAALKEAEERYVLAHAALERTRVLVVQLEPQREARRLAIPMAAPTTK